MSDGKILVADKSSNYLLKLVGDVRLNLCASLDCYMQALFKQDSVNQVFIDMLDTESVDSTTLGLIAKLGLHCRRYYQINVQLFCDNPSILRTLSCMGLNEIIDIVKQTSDIHLSHSLQESTVADADIHEVRQHILQAHRILKEINPNGGEEFADLIRALEADGQSNP